MNRFDITVTDAATALDADPADPTRDAVASRAYQCQDAEVPRAYQCQDDLGPARVRGTASPGVEISPLAG